MLRIGAAIHHHRPKLFEVIKNTTAAGIQKKLRCIKKRDKTSDYVNVDKTQIIRICALLKSWTTNGVNGITPIAFKYKEDGIKLMAQTFFNYHDCKLCHHPHTHNLERYTNNGAALLTEDDINFISSATISNKHHYAKTIGVIKVCISNDLIQRLEELIFIATACALYSAREFFIALKLMRCASKLASGNIDTPTLDIMSEEIPRLNHIWWHQRCNYCKRRSIRKNGDGKQKACTGCMKVTYCSRRCQKLDWTTQHRFKCDRSWDSLYGALKMTIFDRL